MSPLNTTQRLSKKTLERIRDYGRPPDTFEDILIKILDIVENS